MPEVSIEELTLIENCFVKLRQMIDQGDGQDPAVKEIMQEIVKCEQIISSKLDAGGDKTTDNSSSAGARY